MTPTAASESPSPHPPDGAPVARLALRDGAIALAALSVWAAADAWHAVSGLGFAALLAVLDGVLVGAAVTLLAHEWGHFAGARLAGGIAPTVGLGSVFPLFSFDMQRSPARAFRAMSVAGNGAHWAVVLLLAVALPLDTPGRIALLSASFGFAVFGSTTEIPVIRRAFAGASAVESFAGLTGAVLRRNRWVGAGAALALFLVL
jgi:hypothetical protein